MLRYVRNILSKRTKTEHKMRDITQCHPVFCIPDCQSITKQVITIAMNLEVNMKLPVSQLAWLHKHVDTYKPFNRHFPNKPGLAVGSNRSANLARIVGKS